MRRRAATILGIAASVLTSAVSRPRHRLEPGTLAMLDLGPGTSFGPWLAVSADDYPAMLDAQNEAVESGSDKALVDLIAAQRVTRVDNNTPCKVIELRTFEIVEGIQVEYYGHARGWLQAGFVRPVDDRPERREH